nr:transposase [Rhodopirellula maiorica]
MSLLCGPPRTKTQAGRGRDPAVYHPHIHYVVPGGGVKLDDHGQAESWQRTPKNILFHHDTLVRVYKAKLADELRACGLYDTVPMSAWNRKFVVDIQAVGHAIPTLKYLAPYVHRVALSDKRIVAVDDSSVTYTVRRSKSVRTVTQKVEGESFVRGFAQHVLRSPYETLARPSPLSFSRVMSPRIGCSIRVFHLCQNACRNRARTEDFDFSCRVNECSGSQRCSAMARSRQVFHVS